MDPQRLIPGDATLIENIVNYLKAKGIFDEFRHECLADVDTKSSCQNLSQRVDGYTSKFLANETWHPDLNKNELRNKLRRNLDESGMLAVGADHVVEQVINPKIHQLFLPKIIEVVHQYIKEQNELINKKYGTTSSDNASSEKTVYDTLENKVKSSISDPIADILSFSYSKSKATPTTSMHAGKIDQTQQKHADLIKVEKKKEEKPIPVTEKSTSEAPFENTPTSVPESKPQIDREKEKGKKEEHGLSQELSKKAIKEELKPEKKKIEEIKVQSTETVATVEENKANIAMSSKPCITAKKDIDKSKQKLKPSSTQKSSSSSSEIKKPKKEVSDKSTEKSVKSKPVKSLKELSSPTKTNSSIKSVLKEEKNGEITKLKPSDPSSSKISESSVKKLSKSCNLKKDVSTKPKGHMEKADKSKISKSSDKSDQNIDSDSVNEKIDKSKIPKSSDKSDQNIQYDSASEKTDKSKILKSTDKSDQNVHYDSSNSEKVSKGTHYSSSYDSSQGSDQEKSSSSSSKNERQKHFYKHAKKEKSDEYSDKKSITSSDKRRPSDSDESPSKKSKSDKNSKLEKLKDTTLVEAAKITSRSNSFGSTSSMSSSSNASKENMASNSEEIPESSIKDKKKKQVKKGDSCQNPTTVLPPPPPPPPSSSSVLCDLTSSAEASSSMEDTQSSATGESSSSESMSEESSDESELESKNSVSNTLNESILNSSTDDVSNFYDIFLYSSSSSEFEGFENSPEKKKENTFEAAYDSDVSVSSVHTSDLSSYEDEISDDNFSFISESHLAGRKRLTIKEAQELIQNKLLERNKNSDIEKADCSTVLFNDGPTQKSSTVMSSDEESSPSEPKRSLRRERKLNPRYASSEYTSIFNSKKETFITKQSPAVRNNSYNSSPNTESKSRRKDPLLEKGKLSNKSSLESKINALHEDDLEQFEKTKTSKHNSEPSAEKELNDISSMSSSDEMDSIMNKEMFQENDQTTNDSDNNHLQIHLKFKPQNNSKLTRNSYSLKRKLSITESTPAKRPCSRSSVDSSSSEFAPNENKPFNNEGKKSIVEDKILRDGSLKGSDLIDGIKREPFCKQRTNNNGDILGQKDIFSKNSHGKTINIADKTSESDASKELNAL